MNINDNNQLNYDELKKTIAVKHGYNLSDNDPILMFVTLNDFMLNQYKIIFDETLNDLRDTAVNAKIDISNHIKEKEIELFKKIQQINNDNVNKVHTKIKEYFQQEAENQALSNLKQKSNNFIITSLLIFNLLCSIIIILKIFNII